MVNVDRYGNTSSGSIPLALADAVARRTSAAREPRADDRDGGRAHVGLGADALDTSDEWSEQMSKLAFMFPGQGSFELGMGREIAEADPRGDGGVRRRAARPPASTCGSSASTGTAEELTRTDLQQPALVATSLAINAALRARGIVPDYVVGHSVGEFSALGAAQLDRRCARRSSSCASAGSRWPRPPTRGPGSMAAILGLADEVVEALCKKIHNVWPANYNCPGQLVISGETAAVDECCTEAQLEGAPPRRAAARSRAPSTRRSSSSPPSGCARRSSRIDFKAPTAHFVSTVTAQARGRAAAAGRCSSSSSPRRCGSPSRPAS